MRTQTAFKRRQAYTSSHVTMGRVNFIRYTFISETTYRLEHVQTLSCDTKIKLAASGGHGNHQFWGEEFVPQAEDTETRKTFAFVFEAPGGHGRIVLVLSVTIPIKVYELLTKTAIIGLVQGLAPKILPAMIDELREIDMPTTSDGMVSRSVETVPDPTDSPELRRCKFTVRSATIIVNLEANLG